MIKLSKFLELNEGVLDPEEKELSPEIWDSNRKLKKSIKVHILKKLDTWLKNYTSKKYSNVYFLGSMTGYRYIKNSDIDINFIIDADDETLKKMESSLPQGKNLPGTEHPVNYHVRKEFSEDWKRAGPIYDVLKDKWLKEPETEKTADVQIIGNYRVVIELARFFMAGFDSIIAEFHADVSAYETYSKFLESSSKKEDKDDLQELINFKLQEVVSDIDAAKLGFHVLHALRKEAFKDDNEFKISTQIVIKDNANYSINNMIFKYLEKLQYPQKLEEIIKLKDEWLKKLKKE